MKIFRSKGFTMIEVLIAILILSSLSIYTAVSIRDSLTQKQKIQKKIDYSAEVQIALSILNKDLDSFFIPKYPYVDALKVADVKRLQRLATLNRARAAKQLGPIQGQNLATQPVSNSLNNRSEKQPAHGLIGKENALDFSVYTDLVASNTNTKAKLAPVQEVGYYLEDCKNSEEKCLWRRKAHFATPPLDEGGFSFVILKNVTEFNVTYYLRKLEENALDSWSLTKAQNNKDKQAVPKFIKLEISVKNTETEKIKKYSIVKMMR